MIGKHSDCIDYNSPYIFDEQGYIVGTHDEERRGKQLEEWAKKHDAKLKKEGKYDPDFDADVPF